MIKTTAMAIAAVLLATAAQSATLAATATGSIPSFTIDFVDNNNDGLLGFSEITAFSGFTLSGFTFNTVLSLADISGITNSADLLSGLGSASCNGVTSWSFSDGGPTTASACPETYTYEIRGLDTDSTVVPLPAGLPLLVAGLGALALASRKRRT